MVEGDLQRPDGELVDSLRKLKHSSRPRAGVLRNFFVSDIVEIFVLFADLVRVSERHTKKFLAAGLDRITAAGP